MGSLPRPDLPAGPLRNLFDALHELHHRAGWPSLRDMARDAGCSHTTISVAFSAPRLPRWGLLELIVEGLGGDTTLFHRLWLGASAAPDSPEATPEIAVAEPKVVPRELPADVAAFTGRVDELAALDALLDREPAAMVVAVLSGTAGVGKTSLAVHWAHRVSGLFPDGQLYLNLRGYDPDQPVRAADALSTFLRALGVADSAIPRDLSERAARYRTMMAGRRMLVLLDNAHAVEQVRDLLPGTASCFVLVTGRDTMPALVARHGAVRFDLDLLSVAEGLILLGRLVGARVPAEEEHAAELVRRCAGLPLALRIAAELAVSRPGGSLAALVRELGEESRRLDLLAAGGDPGTAVRAVFSWSLRHLSPDAAEAFRLLGLHPGADLDRDAAATLIGGDRAKARPLLDTLSRAHLISFQGTGRAGMHDLLREFAAEQALEIGDEARRAAVARLLDHYLTAAENAMRQAFPGNDPTALSWLDSERANLIAVARLAADGSVGHTIALSAALAPYLDAHGHYHDALALHRLAAHAARTVGDCGAEGHAHNLTGTVLRRLGDYPAAIGEYTRAWEIHLGTGDRPATAEALHGLGLCHWRLGRYDEALTLFTEALEIHREHGDRANEGKALHGLALVFLQLARYEQAQEHNERAIAVYREVGDRTSEGRSRNNLGIVEHRQQRFDAAQRHYEAALRIAREVGNRAGEAVALANLADLYERLGRYEDSYAHGERSLVLCRRIGYRVGQAEALRSMGLALHRLGRSDEAVQHLRHAAALCGEIGEADTKIHALLNLGEVLEAIGHCGEAHDGYRTALELAENTGDAYGLSRARVALESLPRQAS